MKEEKTIPNRIPRIFSAGEREAAGLSARETRTKPQDNLGQYQQLKPYQLAVFIMTDLGLGDDPSKLIDLQISKRNLERKGGPTEQELGAKVLNCLRQNGGLSQLEVEFLQEQVKISTDINPDYRNLFSYALKYIKHNGGQK